MASTSAKMTRSILTCLQPAAVAFCFVMFFPPVFYATQKRRSRFAPAASDCFSDWFLDFVRDLLTAADKDAAPPGVRSLFERLRLPPPNAE
jgi:hypothetical protein